MAAMVADEGCFIKALLEEITEEECLRRPLLRPLLKSPMSFPASASPPSCSGWGLAGFIGLAEVPSGLSGALQGEQMGHTAGCSGFLAFLCSIKPTCLGMSFVPAFNI